jgi:FkbM family methyltransferase
MAMEPGKPTSEPSGSPDADDTSVAGRYAAFRLANRLFERLPSVYVRLYDAYKVAVDHAERRIVRSMVRPGMTCVDVGANVGHYTRLLARLVGPEGRVLAFEPSHSNFALLAHRRLGPNVETFQAAVGGSNGTTALHLSSTLNVDHRTYATDDVRATVQVPLVRLDDALRGEPVDFVKMDVQGYELHVLRGMTGILGGRRPLSMILEFWPWGIRKAGGEPREPLDVLRSAGFSVQYVGGEPVDTWTESPTWYRNLFACRA